MKYVVVLGDGMADYPVPVLGNQTPLAAARKPRVDGLTERGVLGLVKTIPENMPAGSDVANLSVLGYDPHRYYSGRSPFEAASRGIELQHSDVTFRVNLVTLTENEEYSKKTMVDHSAGEISTEEGKVLIEFIHRELGTTNLVFHDGVSYRHLLVWREGPDTWELTPPHDILGQSIGNFLPRGDQSDLFLDFMQKSLDLLKDHPVNVQRKERGLNPANAIWIWGEGKKPRIPGFFEKYQVKGSVISAVDLIKGLGRCAGLRSIDVPGATGNLHTNYRGKAGAALKALAEGDDFVFVHIEAPDECGHRNEPANKVKAIELIDQEVVSFLVDGLEKTGEAYHLLFLPDHATPLSLRTHTRDPVPFLMVRGSDQKHYPGRKFTEQCAQETGFTIPEGFRLMDYFLKNTLPISAEGRNQNHESRGEGKERVE